MCGYNTVVGMVNGMLETLKITVPVALHLDHGSYEGAKACIEAGFSSIMFDGSHYPIEENIAKTTELIGIAHAKGISVEAEVGAIGGEEDGVIGGGEVADPKECKMIADLGVDMLAAGIGNIHGKYPANWKGLNFDVLAEIQKLTGTMPLVLHGGTGIPADMIKKQSPLAFPKSMSTPSASSPSQMLRESTSKQARISRARASTRESSSLRALRRLRLPLRKRWSSSVPSTRLNFSLNRITENAPMTGAFFFA